MTFISYCGVPGFVLSILHIFPHLNLTIAPTRRCYDYLHFADEEFEAQVNEQTWESPTNIKQRLQDANASGIQTQWVWIQGLSF